MEVLLVGGGGREHALAWAMSRSPRLTRLYCAPGNGGVAQIAQCVDIAATDIEGMVRFAEEKGVDLVVVAPDDPLALGMIDALEAKGIRAFGPNKAAARIEASKVFAKNIMKKYDIPTAQYSVFTKAEDALEYLTTCEYPVVVKADGLALGKGVLICQDREQAEEAVRLCMCDRAFGAAGERILIEEFMTGPEVSILAFTDGQTIVPMMSAQDHKRIFDRDKGPNTGGMGTFAPSPHYTPQVADYVEKNIMLPTIRAMGQEGCPFRGVLYFGLMLTRNGPKVLEYNARFGDPETQVVLPLLETDILDIFDAVIDSRLAQQDISWRVGAAVCVVLAAAGYPGAYEKGHEIFGLETLAEMLDVQVFHAGTRRLNDGRLVTNGGRILGVTAQGDSMQQAIDLAYSCVSQVHFEGMQYRHDIGKK